MTNPAELEAQINSLTRQIGQEVLNVGAIPSDTFKCRARSEAERRLGAMVRELVILTDKFAPHYERGHHGEVSTPRHRLNTVYIESSFDLPSGRPRGLLDTR